MLSFCDTPVSRFCRNLIAAASFLAVANHSIHASELLVTDRANNRVLSFDATTGTFNRVVLDQVLFEPAAITMGPGGFAYVAHVSFDPITFDPFGEILKVDPATGAFDSFASPLNFPGGLAHDPVTDTLFMSDFGQFNGELIHQFDSTGATVNTIGAGTGPWGRSGLAFDANGDLYASLFGKGGAFTGEVLKFDAGDEYAPLGVFATQTSSLEQPVPLNGASGLAFDASGNLYVAGLFSQSVVKFPPGGGVDVGEQFGDDLPYPTALVFAEDGNLLVSGLGNNNPDDPIYDDVFPGGIMKYDATTGETIGGGPFIGTKIFSLEDELGADFNDDELVDDVDLGLLEMAFGVSDAADTDDDGDTDGADFLNYQSNYGALGAFQPSSMTLYSPAGPIGAAVPEPPSLPLALIITLSGALLAGRQAKQRVRYNR